MENFPPNSKASQREREPVQRVAVAQARRRRKPLGRQFKETFLSQDGKTAAEYMYSEVVIPGVRDLMFDSAESLLNRIFYGSGGRHRRGGAPPSSYGRVNYGGMFQPDQARSQPPQRMVTQQSRARHDFGEIVLDSRQDAEEVLSQLYDILGQYEEVSVADLYALVGFRAEHTDKTWGWTNLNGSRVGRIRGGGYLLELPQPEYLR